MRSSKTICNELYQLNVEYNQVLMQYLNCESTYKSSYLDRQLQKLGKTINDLKKELLVSECREANQTAMLQSYQVELPNFESLSLTITY